MTAQATPSVIGGRYRVLRELGRGGMGVVYVVEHLGTGDQLALKVLLQQIAGPEMLERFKREARAPAAIKSKHVVRVTDFGTADELDGALFLVMDLLEGEDLEKLVERKGRLAPELVVSYLRQVASALDRAHVLGIVHRDLKPENIFLHRGDDGDPVVKLLDFGISKLADHNGLAGAGLTRTGAVMGTPLYMSPEQAREMSSVGPATDVWAIGLIAFRLITGEIFWSATTMAELMVAILAPVQPAASSRAPGLSSAFDRWFARSIAPSPSDRFESVGAQVVALDEVLRAGLLLQTAAPTTPRMAPATLPGQRTTGAAMASTHEPAVEPVASPKRSAGWLIAAPLLVAGALGAVLVGRNAGSPSREPSSAASAPGAPPALAPIASAEAVAPTLPAVPAASASADPPAPLPSAHVHLPAGPAAKQKPPATNTAPSTPSGRKAPAFDPAAP